MHLHQHCSVPTLMVLLSFEVRVLLVVYLDIDIAFWLSLTASWRLPYPHCCFYDGSKLDVERSASRNWTHSHQPLQRCRWSLATSYLQTRFGADNAAKIHYCGNLQAWCQDINFVVCWLRHFFIWQVGYPKKQFKANEVGPWPLELVNEVYWILVRRKE